MIIDIRRIYTRTTYTTYTYLYLYFYTTYDLSIVMDIGDLGIIRHNFLYYLYTRYTTYILDIRARYPSEKGRLHLLNKEGVTFRIRSVLAPAPGTIYDLL